MTRRDIDAEVRRIQAVFAQRDSRDIIDRLKPGRQLMIRARDRGFARALDEHLTVPLKVARVLDVGCGDGSQLAWLRSAGAEGRNLNGVDLLPDKIERARLIYPDFNLIASNAEVLPFESRRFDLMIAMTVFSSVLDPQMARNLAAEMKRVLKPGGLIFWYDIRYPNPWNPDVRSMTRGRIEELFPDFSFSLAKTTLIPQLARLLGWLNAPMLAKTYEGLAALPFLRSHLLGVLRSPVEQEGAVTSS